MGCPTKPRPLPGSLPISSRTELTSQKFKPASALLWFKKGHGEKGWGQLSATLLLRKQSCVLRQSGNVTGSENLHFEQAGSQSGSRGQMGWNEALGVVFPGLGAAFLSSSLALYPRDSRIWNLLATRSG